MWLQCVRTSERFERLGVRKEEYILLKALVLANCDARVDEANAIFRLRDSLLASLHNCVAVIRSVHI